MIALGKLAASFVNERVGRIDGSIPGNPVRSHSYDVEDPRANEHRPIGDGSPGQLWAFREATIGTLKDLRRRLRDTGYDGDHMIEASTVAVHEALAYCIKRASGKCTPSAADLAEMAMVCERTVNRAIATLEYWGFWSHVRRSERVEAPDGEAGPRHRQASNAFIPNCATRMKPELFALFWNSLERNMKRLSGVAQKHLARMRVSLGSAVQSPPRRVRPGFGAPLPLFQDAGLASAFSGMWNTLNGGISDPSGVAATES